MTGKVPVRRWIAEAMLVFALGALGALAVSADAADLDGAAPRTPFKAVVDLPTFMEHVLSPAADKIWLTSGTIGDATGEHDLTPTTTEQWEQVVTGAAMLAEATNALMIPERARDRAWIEYSVKLSEAAEQAYHAAEAHDVKAIQQVSERLDGICADCHRHYGVE